MTSTSQGSWSLGSNNYGDSIQLYVQNTGSKAIPVPWTLAIGNHYTGVSGVRVQGCLSLVSDHSPGQQACSDHAPLLPVGGMLAKAGRLTSTWTQLLHPHQTAATALVPSSKHAPDPPLSQPWWAEVMLA